MARADGGDPVRVLFVDADSAAAKRVAGHLVDRGAFDVLVVDSTAAALEHLGEADDVDCVVAAHGPDLDGVALVDRVTNQHPALPVVVFPHDGSEELAAAAVENGAEGYVPRSDGPDLDRLASQVRDAAEMGRRRRREAQRARVGEVVREISQAAVRADSRDDLEQQVCNWLVWAGPYLAAVIGSVNPETGETVARAWAGIDGVARERILGPGSAPTSGLQTESVETEEVHVRSFTDDVDAALGATTGNGSDPEPVRAERAAAIPITYGDRLYGVLTLYAGAPHAFDDAELSVLRDLCETTGQAIDSIETRQALERRQEKLARQNERLDAFASVVSHDLRNPLDVVEGYVQIAIDDDDTSMLDEALVGVRRAKTIVEDLLVLARSDRGIRETAPVDVEAVAREAWSHVDTGDVRLVVDGDGTVEADESQLQRLLENLFRNCVEHAGAGTVTVGTTPAGFFVADDGPGIDPEDRDAVFDPGYTTDEGGTGLGLAIVRRIAEAHGWDVVAGESESGGARFDVDVDPD